MKKFISLITLILLSTQISAYAMQQQCTLNIINTSAYSMTLNIHHGRKLTATAPIQLQSAQNNTGASSQTTTLPVLCNELTLNHYSIETHPNFDSDKGPMTAMCNISGVPQNRFESSLTLVIGQQAGSNGESCLVMLR